VRPGDTAYEALGVSFSVTGLERAAALVAKAASIVALVLVLFATAPLQDTFKAAQSLRIPGWLVQLGLMSYRYLHLLGEEFARLRIALRVRGYRNRAAVHSYRTIGHVAGTLLVRGHERSERVAQAMRCRAFDGQFRSLHGFQTRTVDVVFFASVILAAGTLLAWDLWIRS
jgi:cobalt/nickel transport system permease protein